VEIEGIFGTFAFVITMVILVSASIRDWKDREVPDVHWIVLGIIGLVMFVSYSVYMTEFRWEYVCLAAGTAMILLDIFLDREFNPLVYYALMALLFIVPLYHNMSDDIFIAWASVPLCYLIYLGMYLFGIVRGGADAKCLITLSIMFPLYPSFFGLPLIGLPDGIFSPFSQIFVCSISILFLAAILTIPIILYFAVRNARESGLSRRMFFGYRMDISKAEDSDVWPLEDIIEGNLTPIRAPKEEDMSNIYARLREAGHDDVLVTPMIPFIVLIMAATAVLNLAGNPLFLIV